MGALSSGLKGIFWPASNFWPQDYNRNLSSPDRDIDSESAFSFLAYYAGVRLLSEDVASLPLITYRRVGQNKERATDHPMYRVLHDVANPEMSSFTWRETSMGHLIGWGNAFSEIVRNGRGQIVELWPLRPDRMEVRREYGKLIYRYRRRSVDGYDDADPTDIPVERIFHVKGLGYDGLVGYSPLTIMRRAIALGLAAQEYGERTFNNDARPGVALISKKALSKEAKERLKAGWDSTHAGSRNAGRTAVLEDDISIESIGFPPKDAQFLDSRKFQVRDIARGLRIPPHKIADLEQATFSNIDEQAIDYVTGSLRAWFVRWESEINRVLLPEEDVFAEHLVDGLLRGDPVKRAEALQIRRQNGTLNADQWRAIENENPIEDGSGQEYWMPLNFTTMGDVQDAALAPPEVPPVVETPGLTVVKEAIDALAASSNGHREDREADREVFRDAMKSAAERPMEFRFEMPPVSVAAPEVYVSPPDVKVSAPVTVNMPEPPPSAEPRKVTKTVKRDDAGRITEVVEE